MLIRQKTTFIKVEVNKEIFMQLMRASRNLFELNGLFLFMYFFFYIIFGKLNFQSANINF